MARTNFQQFPSPNSKYPFVGPNYQQYGEVNGYIYWPWTDQYYIDPKSQKAVAEQQGLVEKEKGKPGLGSTLVPVAGVVGTGILATELGKGAGQKLSNSIFGPDPSTATTTTTTQAGNASTGMVAPAATAPSGSATTATAATTPTGQPSGMVAPAAATTSGSSIATPKLVGVERINPVGSAANGGTMMSDGSVVMPNGDVTLADGTMVSSSGEVSGGLGVNASQAIAAAAFILQAYNAQRTLNDPNASTADKTAAVGGAAAAGAGAYATTGLAGSSTAGAIAAPVAGVVGLYQGYKTAQYAADAPAGAQRNRNSAMQGAAAGAGVGAAVGSVVPVVGTAFGAAIGAVVGGAAGLAAGMTGSGKDKYQMIRDKGREYLIERGVLTPDYKGTLADGSQFDFGKDGKGLQKLNYDDPLTGQAIALGDVIAAGEGFFGRSKDAMSMLYTNAALSNAGGDINKVRANIMHFAQQRGFEPDKVQNEYNRQYAAGQISKEQLDAYSSTLRNNFGAPKIAVGAPPVDTGTQESPPANQPSGMISKSPAQANPTQAQGAAAGPSLANVPTNSGPMSMGGSAITKAPVTQYNGMLRSRTSSPGIDKNGRRITYGKS